MPRHEPIEKRSRVWHSQEQLNEELVTPKLGMVATAWQVDEVTAADFILAGWNGWLALSVVVLVRAAFPLSADFTCCCFWSKALMSL
jgi:hypothetical protein